jgi:hypothetical protein
MAQTAIIMVLLIACKREVACFRRNETHDEGRAIRYPFGPPRRPPLSEKKWYLKVDFWLLRFSFWQSILVLQRSMAIQTERKCMRYVIRVKGHLDPSWQEWFDHLVITHQSDGTTLLSGSIKDQAALYGILCKMRDLGLTLLSLEASAPIPPPED